LIVHDNRTLDAALELATHGPVRYSDKNSYRVVDTPEHLEKLALETLNRGDIAIVVLQGGERFMEDHDMELFRVKRKRRTQELKDMRSYMSAHPGLDKALGKALKEDPDLSPVKFITNWKKTHPTEDSE
jgi:hypothetical protein